MANAFRSKEDSIVEVIVCLGPISQCFPGVENKGEGDAFSLNAVLERDEGLAEVRQGVVRVFVPDQIEACKERRVHARAMSTGSEGVVWEFG